MRAQTAKAGRAVRFAYRQVGKPYRWGGAGPRSYDCSGLVMAAWRRGGLKLPHRADLQHRVIRRKVGLKHLRPGDLVFFSGDHHVGIYVGHRHFLHAPHTGARVQRGTLTGWRLRSFAGAARPGAPAYHRWPHWVHVLAAHRDQHGNAAHRPHAHAAPAEPDVTPTDPRETPPVNAAPGSGDGAADQASGTGQGPARTPDPATASPAPDTAGAPVDAGPSASAAPTAVAPLSSAPVATAPVTHPSAPDVADDPEPSTPRETAGRTPARVHTGLVIPMLGMSAPRGHAATADGTPVPRPAGQEGVRPRRQRPHATVQRQNDEQRFDRVFDDSSGGDDDTDSGDDGIDLRSLLGGAP